MIRAAIFHIGNGALDDLLSVSHLNELVHLEILKKNNLEIISDIELSRKYFSIIISERVPFLIFRQAIFL